MTVTGSRPSTIQGQRTRQTTMGAHTQDDTSVDKTANAPNDQIKSDSVTEMKTGTVDITIREPTVASLNPTDNLKIFNLSRKTEDALNIIRTNLGSSDATRRTPLMLRNRSAYTHKTNPYLTTGFNENNLFAASNLYQKLEKVSLNQNKAFVQTIFNQTQNQLKQAKTTKHEHDKATHLYQTHGCFPLSQNESVSTMISKFKQRTQRPVSELLEMKATQAAKANIENKTMY